MALSPVFLPTLSLILIAGWPFADAILMTILSGSDFSPVVSDVKSSGPRQSASAALRRVGHGLTRQERSNAKCRLEPVCLGRRLVLQAALDVQRVREHNCLLLRNAHAAVKLTHRPNKIQRVARVLPHAGEDMRVELVRFVPDALLEGLEKRGRAERVCKSDPKNLGLSKSGILSRWSTYPLAKICYP